MKTKSLFIISSLLLTTTLGFSQAGAKWATGGNSIGSGDFIGTTNNSPIDFRTNNLSRATLSAMGVFKINNLAGAGNRLVMTDALGNLISLPAGTANQVLLGNGTWGSIPTPTAANLWQQSGANIYYAAGKVGVNTSSPLVALDIVGDARISNNLYVGGGIIITDKVNAATEVVGFDVRADNDLGVEGNTRLKGNNRLDNGFTFDGINGISYKTTTSGAKIIGIGAIGPIPILPTTCIAPLTGVTTFMGRTGIMAPLASASNNFLDINNDGSNGFIDYGYDINIHPKDNASGVPIPALKINSVCWGDVEIAKGGGFASMGRYFEVGNPVRNAQITSNILAAGSSIAQRSTKNAGYPVTITNPPAQYNTQLFVDRNALRALAVFNTQTNTTGDETFTLYGDGKTQINANTNVNNYFVINNVSTPSSAFDALTINGNGYIKINHKNTSSTPTDIFYVKDISSNLDLFKVKSDGHVYAREVEILNTALAFPDYVFAKDYKMLSLAELETYIANNKHLPCFENAAYYETNGIKSSEMFVKQQEKIEELTLYIIELEKRMKALELKIK
jgi:hypothetical protein